MTCNMTTYHHLQLINTIIYVPHLILCSWSYLLYQLVSYYLLGGGAGQTLWQYLGLTLLIFQNAALLEVMTR